MDQQVLGKTLYVSKQVVRDMGKREIGRIEAWKHKGLLQDITECSWLIHNTELHLIITWWCPLGKVKR